MDIHNTAGEENVRELFEKLKKKNKVVVLVHLCRYWPFRLVSDEYYLKLFYYAYQDKKLDLNQPVTFSEKLQWLKLYDRKSEYTMMTDKYKVREFVKNTIGEKYLIPILGVWDDANEIDFSLLPEQFVLKSNNDSGTVIICKNKKDFNKKEAIGRLNKALRTNYFWKGREWNYKDIIPKVIAEKYMNDGNEDGLTDYKYFCFDGEPKFVQVDSGRFKKHIRNFYTVDWEYIEVENGCRSDKNKVMQKPKNHSEMLNLARKLSQNIPHVRVDFYVSNGKVFFGEMTFHHGGGAMKVEPFEYDKLWGSYLRLP